MLLLGIEEKHHLCVTVRSRRSASTSPYRFGFDKAMDAQERLARRLERAKELTKLKREEEQKNIDEKGFLGLKEDKLKGVAKCDYGKGIQCVQ